MYACSCYFGAVFPAFEMTLFRVSTRREKLDRGPGFNSTAYSCGQSLLVFLFIPLAAGSSLCYQILGKSDGLWGPRTDENIKLHRVAVWQNALAPILFVPSRLHLFYSLLFLFRRTQNHPCEPHEQTFTCLLIGIGKSVILTMSQEGCQESGPDLRIISVPPGLLDSVSRRWLIVPIKLNASGTAEFALSALG